MSSYECNDSSEDTLSISKYSDGSIEVAVEVCGEVDYVSLNQEQLKRLITELQEMIDE